ELAVVQGRLKDVQDTARVIPGLEAERDALKDKLSPPKAAFGTYSTDIGKDGKLIDMSMQLGYNRVGLLNEYSEWDYGAWDLVSHRYLFDSGAVAIYIEATATRPGCLALWIPNATNLTPRFWVKK